MSTTANVGAPPEASPPRVDDMHDAADDAARWPLLAERLELCRQWVVPAFDEADRAAIAHQKRHRWLVRCATVFGTVAILVAIAQLALDGAVGGEAMPVAELALALLAAAAVGLGLVAAFQTRWLLERHKAERLRLAKYRFLIDPDLWCGDPATQDRRVQELKDEVGEIRALTPAQVHVWVEQDTPPEPPHSFARCRHAKEIADQVAGYYRTRRLRYQLDWFRLRARQHQRINKLTYYLSPILFFGSVGAVLAHFIYDYLAGHTEGLTPVSRGLIALAAALPAVGGGVREFRASGQSARNTIRYRAKAAALATIESALDHYPDACATHTGLWYSEVVLENEHREWLRLMLEADGFA
jgi:hypothetical protein